MRTDGWVRCSGMLKKWCVLLVGSQRNGTFRPHVTLGRVRARVRPPRSKWSGELPRLQVPVEAVELIESILKPTRAEHRTLHRAVLTL